MPYIGLLLLANLVSGDHVRDLFTADLDETCSSNALNCFTDGVTAGEYCTNDIEFVGVTHEANSCCYTYRSVYVGELDCEGKKTSQSHWTLSAQCPATPTVLTAGLSKHVDASLCLDGIKFDSACNDINGCDYTICLEFPGEECCTDLGWVAVKSGNTYCIDEVEVPSCLCETPNPTENPTKSPTPSPTPDPSASPSNPPSQSPSEYPSEAPTKAPTPSPSKSPSASPSKSPTRSPSKSPSESPTKVPTPAPSKSPSKSPSNHPSQSPSKAPSGSPTKAPTSAPSVPPTKNPTAAPTPFCTPVVEIHVNEACTAETFHAWDAKIVYAAISQYTSLGEFEGALNGNPQDALSGLILNQSCGTDHVDAFAQPLLAEPVAVNIGVVEERGQDVDHGTGAESDVPAVPWVDINVCHPTLFLFGAIVYGVVATVVALYCWCKARRMKSDRMRMERYAIESDADAEEEEKREKKFML